MYLGGVKTDSDLSTIKKEQRTILLTAAVFGLLGVLLGTFGAHGVQQKVSTYDYKNYEKGVQYHYYFTTMLFVLGLLTGQLRNTKGLFVSFVLFSVGILLFSGSLYFIATRNVHEINFPGFVYLVTPMGGFCFMLGWIWLIVTLARLKTTNPL
jgi:uncharacterized membrane protein YgdD (TMEM256/DUF423 family)